MKSSHRKLILKMRSLEKDLSECKRVCDKARPSFFSMLKEFFPEDADACIFKEHLKNPGALKEAHDVQKKTKQATLAVSHLPG